MRRRGLPIVWIGFIAILIAFVVWYGWQTNIAPYIAEQRAQQRQSEPQQAVPVPREEEIKAQLQRNQAAISAQPEPKATTQNRTEACYAPPPMPQPDPKRDVVEYWWETAPPKTKK
jgi:hypothetical protein